MNFYELLFNRGQPSGEGMTHFERLFAAKLVGGGEIKELEGVPPLLFKANGEPLIDWSIYGNTVQNGTPTPENPIMPQGTGERTGNLFDSSTIEVGGLNPSMGAETTDNTRRRSGFISVEPSTNYGLSREITSSGSFFWVIAYDENKNIVTDATISAQYSGVLVQETTLTVNQWTFTTTPTTKYIRWYVTVNNSYKNIMLNLGSTALPYEPWGVKIPISSASTTTPVYLGEVETTRRIRKMVFDGTENWDIFESSKSRFFYTTLNPKCAGTTSNYFLCTHRTGLQAPNTKDSVRWYDNDTDWQDVVSFKAWLAAQYANGTPVTVWYVLATEETAVVNEPLMKIGNYADSLTATQAGVEVPTIKGNNTLDIDATIKPSNVYIKYKT